MGKGRNVEWRKWDNDAMMMMMPRGLRARQVNSVLVLILVIQLTRGASEEMVRMLLRLTHLSQQSCTRHKNDLVGVCHGGGADVQNFVEQQTSVVVGNTTNFLLTGTNSTRQTAKPSDIMCTVHILVGIHSAASLSKAGYPRMSQNQKTQAKPPKTPPSQNPKGTTL